MTSLWGGVESEALYKQTNPPSRCSVIPGWGDERMGGVESEALHKKLTGSFTDAPSGKACAPDLGVGVIIGCGVEEFTDISSSA